MRSRTGCAVARSAETELVSSAIFGPSSNDAQRVLGEYARMAFLLSNSSWGVGDARLARQCFATPVGADRRESRSRSAGLHWREFSTVSVERAAASPGS